MYVILSIILILASILLIAVVLLQPGKGDLSASFGGISGQFGTMFGMRRTMDFLTKFTIYLAGGILLVSLITNKFFLSQEVQSNMPIPVTEGTELPMEPPPTQPQQPQVPPPGQ